MLKLIILQNEFENDIAKWVYACEKFKTRIDFFIVDLTKHDWMDNILRLKPDILLTKPGGLTAPFKQLYDERLMILVKELGYKCFPTLDEVLIYENKRYFSYWLKSHKIPHPQTDVFYFKEEAIDFAKSVSFPIVGKVNIGASGSGVKILKDFNDANEYINHTFSGKGAKKRNGPNLENGKLFWRGIQYVLHPGRIKNKINIYRAKLIDVQTSFVIFQQYIPHEFEWRVVRIGESFFAHKKLKLKEKASGSLRKNYDNPPLNIFDFVREITNKFGLYSQAIDIFELNGEYLVNEMQCIFGQSDPFQMLVDGKPGRYIYINGKWTFEPGDFNSNESYDLRVETILSLFSQQSISPQIR